MASIDNVNDKQLMAGYLRGKPRSRSMHAATIEEHIKCTGYCRRDPYRQLLVSCCQPRRWTSRTYFYTGCFASNRFSKLSIFRETANIPIFFASYSWYLQVTSKILTHDALSRNFDRSNCDFNFSGTIEISAHVHFTIFKNVHKIFTKYYEFLQTIQYINTNEEEKKKNRNFWWNTLFSTARETRQKKAEGEGKVKGQTTPCAALAVESSPPLLRLTSPRA